MGFRRVLLWSAVWATAFGFLEAAVVVYLREIAYPDGFAFPLKDIAPRLLRTELVRELTTLVMLFALARLAVRGGTRRFAVFCYCFGVWDIVFYVGLKVFLDWPQSLMTWDILFLIPFPWTGPVLAPVLVSVALIAAGVAILREPDGRSFAFLRPADWLIEVGAGLAVLGAFWWNVPAVAAQEAPAYFPWWLFLLGLLGGGGWFCWRWSHASDYCPRTPG